jgi:hypothetical protein
MASEETPLPLTVSLFRQTSRLFCQVIWKRRQEISENGRIFHPSQVYLLLRERNTRIQHNVRENRHAHDARSLPYLEPTLSVER